MLKNFRATIRGHVGSIEVLLATVQMEMLQLQAKERDQQTQSLAGMIHTFASQIMAKLDTVTRSVSNGVQQGKA